MLLTDRELVDPTSAIGIALADFAPATYAPTQLGRTQSLTPEGYLLCSDVRLARTGPMMYSHKEMGDAVEPPASGAMIAILRDAAVLFDPTAMLSFAGKPVTNDHPGRMVSPSTYRDVDVGTVLNPRRGEGPDAEYLIGDLLIKDAQAIKDIQAGKREVSLGYDAEIEQIKPGLGRQTKITGNHAALVRRGRAGPNCSIRDAQEGPMATRTLLDRLRTAFKANDEAAFDEELAKVKDEAAGDSQRVIIQVEQPKAVADKSGAPTMDAAVEARFKGIEDSVKTILDAVAKLVPTTDAEAAAAAAKKLADEAAAAEAAEKAKKGDDDDKDVDKKGAMDAIAKAEILAPGVRLPAMDAATVKTSAVVALQRKALTLAMADSARKVHVDAALGGRTVDLDALPPSELRVVFDSAAALTRVANNSAGARKVDVPQGPMTALKYQALIDDRRKKRA